VAVPLLFAPNEAACTAAPEGACPRSFPYTLAVAVKTRGGGVSESSTKELGRRTYDASVMSPGRTEEIEPPDADVMVAEQRESAAVPGGPRRRAVIVTHGMGQQLRFETLTATAEGLLRVGASGSSAPCAVRAPFGDDLARLELALNDANGRPLRVDVYEAYWAPLTEGRVRYSDVVRFLAGAGLSGLRAGGSFQRWVLGAEQTYAVSTSSAVQLMLALGVVTSIAVIELAVPLLGARYVYGLVIEQGGASQAVLAATAMFAAGGLAAVVYALSLAPFLRWLSKPAFYLLCATVVAIGIGLSGLAVSHLLGAPWGLSGWLAGALPHPRCPIWIAAWALIMGATVAARSVLVQYLGDVAAYVSPHTLDRFDELRHAIRERVCSTFQAIYGARDEHDAWLYDEVAVVGHSLGSVVTYDCLNTALNADLRARGTAEDLRVLERTSLLLTFGSPLDKTAFVFATHKSAAKQPGRLALAATSQPLILGEKFTDLRWVNVYSPNDIVSGELDYFGPANGRRRNFHNVRDDDAQTFVLAHVQYWNGTTVWKELMGALGR
jgi:hypothetical protein